MEKVSVIIPVYGVEKYIKKCLDSIVNQTYKNLEILVVNDGTLDNSIKIIEDNFDDERIKIFNRQNGGQASARNFALTVATGKYILYVDGDDFIGKNMIKDMYDKMKKDNTNLVICDYYKYYKDDNKEHIDNIPYYDKNNQKCSVICMPGPVCKLFKKDILLEYDIQFPKDICFEDNAIMPFACAVSKEFSYIKEPYYYYLQREGSSLNKKQYDKKWEGIFNSLAYLSKRFTEANLETEYHMELEYIYIEYLLHAASLRFIDYQEGIINIKKIAKVMKEKYPKWRKNIYYKKSNIKYKVMCNLIYYNQIKLIKMLRKK